MATGTTIICAGTEFRNKLGEVVIWISQICGPDQYQVEMGINKPIVWTLSEITNYVEHAGLTPVNKTVY